MSVYLVILTGWNLYFTGDNTILSVTFDPAYLRHP